MPSPSRPRTAFPLTPLLAALLGLGTALVGVVLPAGRAEAATTALKLTGPTSAWSDQHTQLTARWTVGGTGERGTLTLQRRDGSVWRDVSKAATSSTGSAHFVVAPTSSMTYRVRSSTGTGSAALTLRVTPAYALGVSAPAAVTTGSAATLSAHYTYHAASEVTGTILVERLSGSSWVRVTTFAAHAGRGSTTVTPTATTTYRLRTARATSATRRVAVGLPSSFTVTGAGAGHGVGLSQYGAYAMALQGSSAASILTHFYQGTSVAAVTGPERIKVQVWGPEPYGYTKGLYSDTGTSTTLSFTSSWSVAGSGTLTGTSADTLRVAVVGDSLVLTRLRGTASTATVTAPAATASFTTSWTGIASVAGSRGTYHDGTLVLTAIGGQPNVVVDLLLDTEYLYGIDEMPSSWGTAGSGKGLQALEAQAVIARTYVLYGKQKLQDACDCNVVDDVRDQSYTGASKASRDADGVDLWRKAVDATRGQAVTFGGTAAQTPYFAASGGRTADNADVWQGSKAGPQLDYLRSVDDPAASAPGNPYVSWTDTISQATARATFPTLPDVTSIRVDERYSSGQVRTLVATASTGKVATVSASADWWRSALGVPGSWVSDFTPHP
ncbi:SpoIID/LytB domain-containing protein [Luteimicrobium subarcticum]|uniref:SpoIID/LytB domain protein n=1 Tax=Luteimicrobium subarcticum TaxID=620910 RepID=A0A2M8W3N0_9MICO|nr:SpoIID/LytB domain-containing protein [Luteimicrobium subarcticum]PJI85525.1 SpoIID/LytB domain protein [Luteimicrobium subarcticum]